VTLVPIDDGLVVIRRSIEPARGRLALPGGYIDMGESWQEAAIRELREETGIEAPLSRVSLYTVETALNTNCMLVFAVVDLEVGVDDLPAFEVTDETDERVILGRHDVGQLAFSTHQKIASAWFDVGWAYGSLSV
jgi:ADP-ribose pyrophosphatase YjhB (NUDIX family)